MEWVPQLEFIRTVARLFNGQLPVIIFNYLLIIGMLLEMGLLLRAYHQLNKIELRLERKKIAANGFLAGLVGDYQQALEKRKNREAGPFVEDYFQKKKGNLLQVIYFIEQSPGYYLLAGFMGFFLIMLLALFNLDLEGLNGAEDFSRRLISLDGALKTGGYTVLTGFISSLILYLVTRAWGTGRKIVKLKEKLSGYLDDVVWVEVDRQEEDPYLDALQQLNLTIENSLFKLEEMLEDAFAASLAELEGQLKDINTSLAEYRDLTQQFHWLKGLDQRLERLYSYQSEAAGTSDRQNRGEQTEKSGNRRVNSTDIWAEKRMQAGKTGGKGYAGEKGSAGGKGSAGSKMNIEYEGEDRMANKYKMVHACIRVMNLEDSIKFYQDALGFEISSRRDYPGGGFTLVYLKGADGDFELELTYNYDREEPYTIGNGFSHLAVTVADLKASYEEHKKRGYQLGEIHSLTEGSRGFYFITDPDGYEVEVIQG